MSDPMVTDLAIFTGVCLALWLASWVDEWTQRRRERERRRLDYLRAEAREALNDMDEIGCVPGGGRCEYCGDWGHCCVCGNTHEKTVIEGREVL